MKTTATWLKAVLLAGRLVLLTVVAIVLFGVSAIVSGMAKAPPPQGPAAAAEAAAPAPDAGAAVAPEPGAATEPVVPPAARQQPGPGFALALLAVCALISLAVAPTVLHSRWGGWRAVLALAVLLYGQMTVLSQAETVVYLANVSGAFLGRMFVFGALFAASLAAAAVLILGRIRGGAGCDAAPLPRMGWSWWAWRVAAVAVLHVATYYVAGYYLAWKNPALRAYYGGSDPGSFLLQLEAVAVGTPWMIPYQFAQGIVWALLAVLLVRMLSGSRLVTALTAALLMGVVGPIQLLLPNPIMPDEVRTTHLVETIVSRVVFGFLAAWLLRPAERSGPPQDPA